MARLSPPGELSSQLPFIHVIHTSSWRVRLCRLSPQPCVLPGCAISRHSDASRLGSNIQAAIVPRLCGATLDGVDALRCSCVLSMGLQLYFLFGMVVGLALGLPLWPPLDESAGNCLVRGASSNFARRTNQARMSRHGVHAAIIPNRNACALLI
jgi:hypothetical protein